jgi:hypothetical protein
MITLGPLFSKKPNALTVVGLSPAELYILTHAVHWKAGEKDV